MANTWGNSGKSNRQFSWAPKSLQMVTAAMKLKDACSLEEKTFLVAQTVKRLSTMLTHGLADVESVLLQKGPRENLS